MRIVKNIIGTLEVDEESKTLYVNSLGQCMLRLRGLEFLNFNEKFSRIDSSENKKSIEFIQGDQKFEAIDKAMPRIISLVSFIVFVMNNENISDIDKFLSDMQREIKRIFLENMEVKKAMTLLNDLLKEMKGSNPDETLRKVCDTIYKDQEKDIKHLDALPRGPNIFIALECKEDFQRYNYLCIEREENSSFIISHWIVSKSGSTPVRRNKAWPATGMSNEKIIEFYLKKFQFMNGE